VFAIFDIWRKTTKGLSVDGLLAEFLTMALQNTKKEVYHVTTIFCE
jgi:hypothetical protein